jgi:acetylornithine/succinyldiaminopimelate/putrescine aminotransferase
LTVAKDLGNGLSTTAAAIVTNAKSGSFNSNVSTYAMGKSALVIGLKYGF